MSEIQSLGIAVYIGVWLAIVIINLIGWLKNYGDTTETLLLGHWIRESRLHAITILLAPLWPIAALAIIGAIIRDAFKKEA